MRYPFFALGFLVAAATPVFAQSVGVPACDKMLKVYETCILPKAGAAEAQMKSTFSQMRANWQQVASTPEGKKSLEPVCLQTTEQLKSQLASLKCEW